MSGTRVRWHQKMRRMGFFKERKGYLSKWTRCLGFGTLRLIYFWGSKKNKFDCCCIIESFNMFCWYVFAVTCFPIFFGKHDAVHPSVTLSLRKVLDFFHSLHINPSEMARKPQIRPKFILEIVAFDDTTSLTAGCWGTLDATETKESISTKTRIQRFHHDKVREVTPLFLVLCFCCTRRCFGWFLTWFGFVGVDVAYHISNWIEWRVNVVFLLESCYISWFKKLFLFICGYTLYLLRNSWKFEKAVCFMMASSRFRCNSDYSVWYCHWCELLHYPETAACSCISISAKT